MDETSLAQKMLWENIEL